MSKEDFQFPTALILPFPKRKHVPKKQYTEYEEDYKRNKHHDIVPLIRHHVNEPLILSPPNPQVSKYIEGAYKGSLFTVRYAVYDASRYTWVHCTDGFDGYVIRPFSYLDESVILQSKDIIFKEVTYFGNMYVNGEDLWTTQCGQQVNVFAYIHPIYGRILLVPASGEYFSYALIPHPSLLN
jgi:hypothetical protein